MLKIKELASDRAIDSQVPIPTAVCDTNNGVRINPTHSQEKSHKHWSKSQMLLSAEVL